MQPFANKLCLLTMVSKQERRSQASYAPWNHIIWSEWYPDSHLLTLSCIYYETLSHDFSLSIFFIYILIWKIYRDHCRRLGHHTIFASHLYAINQSLEIPRKAKLVSKPTLSLSYANGVVTC